MKHICRPLFWQAFGWTFRGSRRGYFHLFWNYICAERIASRVQVHKTEAISRFSETFFLCLLDCPQETSSLILQAKSGFHRLIQPFRPGLCESTVYLKVENAAICVQTCKHRRRYRVIFEKLLHTVTSWCANSRTIGFRVYNTSVVPPVYTKKVIWKVLFLRSSPHLVSPRLHMITLDMSCNEQGVREKSMSLFVYRSTAITTNFHIVGFLVLSCFKLNV